MIISFPLDQKGTLTEGKFAINEQEKSEIICIIFNENLKMFFCGHNSGNISAWKISEETMFLTCVANSNCNIQIHDDSVNYLTCKDNFLISCSSDNFVKVFNLENNFENVLAKDYECVRIK